MLDIKVSAQKKEDELKLIEARQLAEAEALKWFINFA